MHKGKPLRLKLPRGQVAFRMLTSARGGGAVIGKNGAVQKKLRYETGVDNIRVEDLMPGSGERIITVVGSGKVDRLLTVEDGSYGGERKFEVSAVQAAIVRVYETVEEWMVTAGEMEEVMTCRLLVVAADKVWKRENDMKKIERECGAEVRVLPPEMLPLCADLSDDLIQISGDTLAVKKALIAVTHCLQGTKLNVTTSQSSGSTSSGQSPASQSSGSTSSGQSPDTLSVKDPSPEMAPTVKNQCDSSDADTKQVSFRLICSAGGLICSGEAVIEALETESGACIQVSAPVVGCDDRVITISAMENKGWQYSPAQNAVAHVFVKYMEDASRSRHAAEGSSGESVTARLLISSSEANVVKPIISNMQNTEVRILDGHHTQLAAADDKVVQISGEYSEVHIGLFLVTWELRENMFAAKFAVKSAKKNGPLLPHEQFGRPPCGHDIVGLEDEIHDLDISDEVNNLPEVLPSQFPLQDPVVLTSGQNGCDLITSSGSSELGSEDGFTVIRNTEIEILIPADVFGRVYGIDGSNVARIRQISGASVIIDDPSPGTDVKGIISGTPNQTQAAMSMLSAFLNEEM